MTNSTSQPGDILVNGVITSKEFKRYGYIHNERFVKWFTFILFLIVFANFFFELYQPEESLSGWIAFLSVNTLAASFFAAILYVVMRMLISFKSTREFKSDQTIINDITYHFSEQGIRQEVGRSTNYYEWNHILSVREGPTMFMLYISRNKAILLPKRFFHSDEEIRQFQKLLGRHIDRKKIRVK